MLARSRSERASGRTRNQKHTLFPAEEMSASLSPTFWHRSRAPAWSRALAKSRRVRRLLWAALKFPTGYRSCLCPFQNNTLVVVPVPVVVVVVVNRSTTYCIPVSLSVYFLSSRMPLPGTVLDRLCPVHSVLRSSLCVCLTEPKLVSFSRNTMLGACLDDGAPPPITASWCRSAGASKICYAVAAILGAPCADLLNEGFLRQTIRSVGLTFDARRNRIYGVESPHMGRSTSQGLLQDAHQLAAALHHFGSSSIPIRTYLEVGVWSAQTSALVSAYLLRKSRGRHDYRGYACDRWGKYITAHTKSILSQMNVSFIIRHQNEYQLLVADAGTVRIDLCFIDADHTYNGVRNDYEELKTKCRTMMFHDTIDFDVLTREGGGVPIFWSELVQSVNRSRVYEFISQPAVYPPVLGIGVLEPNTLTGDGCIDAAVWQPANMGAGRRPQAIAFWEQWLCKHVTQPSLTRGLSNGSWVSSLVTHCRAIHRQTELHTNGTSGK